MPYSFAPSKNSSTIAGKAEGIHLRRDLGADEFAGQAAKGQACGLGVVHVVHGEHPAAVEIAFHGLVGVRALLGQLGRTVQLCGEGGVPPVPPPPGWAVSLVLDLSAQLTARSLLFHILPEPPGQKGQGPRLVQRLRKYRAARLQEPDTHLALPLPIVCDVPSENPGDHRRSPKHRILR